MTISRQMTTRSVSKTRSGAIFKPAVKKTIKRSIETKQHIKQLPPHAECVELSYHTIHEILELYRKNPSELNLGWLQEAIALTVEVHRASCL